MALRKKPKLLQKTKLRFNNPLLVAIVGLVVAIVGLIVFRSFAAGTLTGDGSPSGSSCGPKDSTCAILFGSNRPDENDTNFATAELQSGRKFDIVRIFHDSWATSFTKELDYSRRGYVVHTSFKPWGSWRQVSADLRNPASARRAEVEAMATSMQTQMPGPFFFTINHEPENNLDAASGNSEQDYADMFCAFSFIFKAKGATKAKFAPVAIPDFYTSDQSTGAKFYPGDQCVDWNGVDPYNFFKLEKTTAWRTIAQIMKNQDYNGTPRPATGFYQWATTDFTGQSCTLLNNPACYGNVRKLDGSTELKQAEGKKPIVIGEWGSVEYYPCVTSGCDTPHAADANKKATWLRQALADFKSELPQVKAIQYWGTIATSADATKFHCFGNDTRFNTTLPASMSCSTNLSAIPLSYSGPSFTAFSEIAKDSYLNMTAGLTDTDHTSAAAQKRFNFVISQ